VTARLIQPFVGFQGIQKVLRLSRETTCDDCVLAVQDLESNLASNGTAENIAETLHAACAQNFPSQALEQGAKIRSTRKCRRR
jgi:hypothetical protein